MMSKDICIHELFIKKSFNHAADNDLCFALRAIRFSGKLRFRLEIYITFNEFIRLCLIIKEMYYFCSLKLQP